MIYFFFFFFLWIDIQGFLKKLRRKHRPAYYQFPGYYLMIEDATGKHCAINIKEYDTSSGLPRLKPKRAVKGGTDVIRAIHALEEDCLQGSISSVETKVAVDKVSEDYVEKKKKQALYCETCKLRCEDLDEASKYPFSIVSLTFLNPVAS
ncbi:hypothetical protein BY458DRAFT_38599 [Sporodiniella umbellata]|nr:hypothetical protein BY458DRAFT_38599 [Sporodiniella umbellata]